jgi:endonuclease/exonuclease/phosphatase family metal-dependent hydrolase
MARAHFITCVLPLAVVAMWLTAVVALTYLLPGVDLPYYGPHGRRLGRQGPPPVLRARVVTFNARNGKISDADDGENAWRHRRGAFTSALSGYDADVVCLQEASRAQLDDILDDLASVGGKGEWGHIAPGRTDGLHGGETAAVLWRASSLRLLDSSVFWLSSTPTVPGSMGWGAPLPRISAHVVLQAVQPQQAQKPLHIFCTHLDHASNNARERGASVIAVHARAAAAGGRHRGEAAEWRATAEEAEDAGKAASIRHAPSIAAEGAQHLARHGPVVVLGDMNSIHSDPPLALLTSDTGGGFVDALAAADPVGHTEGTLHLFRGVPKAGLGRLDFLLASNASSFGGGGPMLRVDRSWVDRAQHEGRWTSDHFPVLADLVWEWSG